MDTIDKIIELLNECGYSQKDLTDYLGIKKSVFSAWKNGTSKSYNKYLTQIADFFKVNVEDIKIYELKNAAIQKHGFYWELSEREELKSEARGAISKGNLSSEQMVESAIIIFKALFSRSLESYNFSPKHVDFGTYSAMLLNQGKRQRSIFGDLSDEEYEKLYNKLVDKFGKKEGIPEGTYYPYERYHHIDSDESHKKLKRKNNNFSTDEIQHIKKYRVLDKHGKKMVDFTLNEEYNRCTSIPESDDDEPKIEIRHSIYKVSAGTGFDLGNNDDWETIYIPDSPEGQKADFALTIKGDSMEPIYFDGDVVLVKEQSAVDIGQIGIFTIEGEGYIKKYGGDRLISLNAEYDDIIFSDYDEERIRCVGKVIGRV